MPINTLHSSYGARVKDWQRVRDAIDGETAVKEKRDEYLPIPPGMRGGNREVLHSGRESSPSAYKYYLEFAEFPEIVAPALVGFQGLIHGKSPTIVLPEKLEYLLDEATPSGMTLERLWQLVTCEVLTGGRVGLLTDVDPADDTLRIVPYPTESIINWRIDRSSSESLLFLVLREDSEVEGDDSFTSKTQTIYRELRVVGAQYVSTEYRTGASAAGTIVGAVGSNELLGSAVAGGDPQPESSVTVSLFGRSLDQIPFTCINALHVGFDYGPIPIMGLVRRVFRIYKLTADYFRSLYIKADPQPWIVGIDKNEAPTTIGGEEIWTFRNPEAKVGHLDIDGQGIPLQAEAIEAQYEKFDAEGGRLRQMAEGGGAESGEALRRRMNAGQVTLRNVVVNVGRAFESHLKSIAVLAGLDPEEVSFTPDLDFSEPTMTGASLLEWQNAKNQGAPIARRTIHDLMRRGGVTELTFEDEEALIEEDDLPPATEPPGNAPVAGEEGAEEGTEGDSEADPGSPEKDPEDPDEGLRFT